MSAPDYAQHPPPRLALVSTFTSDRAVAEALAARLIITRLAAATHLTGPVTSTYWWQQQVQHATEWCVEAVTTPERADAVAAEMRRGHDYDLPVITTVMVTTTADSATWAREGTQRPAEDPVER